MQKTTLCAMVLVAVLAAGARPATAGTHVRTKLTFCRAVKRAPVLDGRLDDPCWQRAYAFDDFGFLKWGSPKGKTPDQFPATRGQVAYDKDYLYFNFRCSEPHMDRFEPVLNRSAPIFARDCLEIYIDTKNDDRGYVCVWANAKGEKMSERRIDMDWAIVTDHSFRLWARYDYAAEVTDAAWIVEGRVAWKDMDVEPRPGLIMGFNPCRFRFSHKPVQFLCWSTIGESQKQPELYGHMVLGDRPDDVTPVLARLYPAYERMTIHVPQGDSIAVFEGGTRTAVTYRQMLEDRLSAAADRLETLTARLADAPASGHQKRARQLLAKAEEARAAIGERAAATGTVTESAYLAQAASLDKVDRTLEHAEWTLRIGALLATLKTKDKE